jgi:uncharacterized protein YndB with AHSA1/START domain
MTTSDGEQKVVKATRSVHAPAEVVFALIADPSEQPRWDGNANLQSAAPGQRVTRVGDVFLMTLTQGQVRENHIVEFEEGRLIAWRPSEPKTPPPGHLWRWEIEPVSDSECMVTHTYDWTELTDPARYERARNTTSDKLRASIDRLAALAEDSQES